MKLAYERPMMHAEMYQTNAYCASACTTPNMSRISLKDASSWWNVPVGLSPDISWGGAFENKTPYLDFTFGGAGEKTDMRGSDGEQQYYWTTNVDGKNYYLESSAGWTNKYNDYNIFGNKVHDEYGEVFVFYQENTGNTELNAAVGPNDGYAGSDSDNNDPDFDDSIFAVVFNKRTMYWST